MIDDLIGRAEAQTAIQFAARRYTVAHEAHGEGQVVWSDNLINVTDAMNVLRDLPSAEPDTTTHDSIPAETGENDGDGTSGDCISRTQAIDALHCRFADGFEEDRWWNSTHVIAALKELPAVPPERKTGRWTLRRVTYLWEGVECEKFETRCSSCGRLPISGIKSTYCPNCGADMRGEENEIN